LGNLKSDNNGGTPISRSQSESSGKYIFESDSNNTRKYSDTLEIHTVSSKHDFRFFYHIPFEVYKKNRFWVAPFWSEMKGFFHKKNPFWSHAAARLFIARRNGESIGRIAAIIDWSYCKTIGEPIGFFGFFECTQDFECTQALLQEAEQWLISKQMKRMQGPVDGRIDVGCGFLLMGFDSRPSLLSTYTPEYYTAYAEKLGLKKVKDLFLYTIDLTKPIPKQLEEKAQQSLAKGIHVRRFHRLRTRKELRWWVKLFLETFSDHWGYVPVSPDEVKSRFGIKQLRWFVDSKLFLIAESRGVPVAYLWATPDYNKIFQKMKGRLGPLEGLRYLTHKHTISSGKLHLIGIKKEFRNHSIGSLLNYLVLVEMKNRGYTRAEVGWIDEQNTIAHTTIALTGATVFKKHRVYEKSLVS
jgi:hypothetical protein